MKRIYEWNFPEKLWRFIVLNMRSSSGNLGLRKWRWKFTNYIPVEPVFHQECKYGIDFNYRLLYRSNRRKKGNASKLQSKITHAIRNGNSIYKLICDLQCLRYNIHNTIEAITRCEIQPSWVQYRRNRAIELQIVKQMQDVASGCVWWYPCSSKISESNKFLDCDGS